MTKNRQQRTAALAMLGLAVTAACGSTAATTAAGLQISDVARVQAPADAPVAPAADGIAAFGADLLHEVGSDSQGNVVVSPASLSLLFAMLRPGARGQTGRQIDNVLHFPADGLGAAYNALSSSWTGLADGGRHAPELSIGNALWAQDGLPLKSAYLDQIARDFAAGVRTVDFASPSAANTINAWVQQQTHGRIDKLFDQLDPSTKLVLTNAVYLKATWKSPFAAGETYDATFDTSSGGSTRVPTMHATQTYDYATGPRWRAVRLPYVGGLSMEVLLPNRRDGDPMTLLDPATLASATGMAERRPVELALPKWDFQSDLPLTVALQAMGMRDAFSSAADFSVMSPQALAISQVQHRADITVDEKGTVAAAVSGLAMATSAVVPPPHVVQLHVDHPFAFVIVDDASGAPLFEGTVGDPSATQ